MYIFSVSLDDIRFCIIGQNKNRNNRNKKRLPFQDSSHITREIIRAHPAGIYLFKVNKETPEQCVKFLQS